ncbi:MAG TPA: hypothetical protein VM871_11080 [Flavisolibacter sp.]|nr:hypothetical protein [Flavisolibacter sp.]
MILLEMYLNGQLIDTAQPCAGLLRTQYSKQVKELATELKQKHTSLLASAEQGPTFILSGVQSSINYFTPLKHP